MKKPYSPVTTLQKALSILELVAKRQPVRSVELSHSTGLSRSNVNRLMATLREMGYVESQDGKHFHLGFKVFVLGNSVSKQNQLVEIARPFNIRLAEICQENVNLGVLYDGGVLYINKIESPHYVKLDRDMGLTDPVYCTALGKVLLTGLTEPELAALVESIDLVSRTSKTITDRKEFISCVRKVKQEGYATDIGELSEEIHCMAAPILDRQERVIAAVSIAAPAVRMPVERIAQLQAPLLEAVHGISKTIGYCGTNVG